MRLPLALLALALAVSGCASDDPSETGTTETGAGTGTDPTDTPDTTAPVDPVGTTHTCTAAPGQVIGLGGPTVAGCDLVTLDADSAVQSIDVPSGCSVSYDEDGDGQAEGVAEAGATYTEGTNMFMGCDAANAQSEGSITIAPA